MGTKNRLTGEMDGDLAISLCNWTERRFAPCPRREWRGFSLERRMGKDTRRRRRFLSAPRETSRNPARR